MREDFLRLDELLATSEDDLTEEDSADLERLVPLLVEPAYQEHRLALISAGARRLS